MAKSPLGKRVNKNKEEITVEMKKQQKVQKFVSLAKLMFPFMKDLKSIYDAQTALSAVSGYVKFNLGKKISQITVKDLAIDLSSEPESDIKAVVVNFLGQLENESAEDAADLCEKYSATFTQFASSKYLLNPMSEVKMEDVIQS